MPRKTVYRCYCCLAPLTWAEVNLVDVEGAENVFACGPCKAEHAREDDE